MKKKDVLKKIVLIMLSLVMFSSPLMAQVAADPNDSFYVDALRWELQGLVSNLPEMRPYSLQLVKSILETVMNSDDEIAANDAKTYYDRYFTRAIRVGFETSLYAEKSDAFEKQIDINPVFYGNAEFLENATISFEATPMLSTVAPRQDFIPKYQSPKYDAISDNIDKVGSAGFNIYSPFNAVAAVGSDEIYFQAGLNRNAFGNILDTGVVIGATAPHVGSLVFTINKEKFNYQLAMLMLKATGKGTYFSKYLYLHSLRYSFTDKLDFTIFESALTGPYFDFKYLMPIVPYMAMQHIYGCDTDNLWLGATLTYKPTKGMKVFFTGYADDLSFNEIVKLDFDARLKFALETGIQYSPVSGSLCDLISVDYTIVTPYTYSHSMRTNGKLDITGPNYQNYTSRNVEIGSMIGPNSDRFRFDIKLAPVKNLQLNVKSSIARHGNINETLYKKALNNSSIENLDAYESVSQYLFNNSTTDGSINDIPYAENSYLSYPLTHFMFLDETTNYVCFQNSFDLAYSFQFENKSEFSVNFGYTFQYEKNVGVGNNMFRKVESFNKETTTEAEIISELNNQYDDWKNKLREKFSNYFSISFKYIY